jgi:hypothetical protein
MLASEIKAKATESTVRWIHEDGVNTEFLRAGGQACARLMQVLDSIPGEKSNKDDQ